MSKLEWVPKTGNIVGENNLIRKIEESDYLMAQSGGESVRVAVLANEEIVLESYSSREERKIVTTLTPVNTYIEEEFHNYGAEVDIEERVKNLKEVVPIGATIKELYADEYENISKLSDGAIVISRNDEIIIVEG